MMDVFKSLKGSMSEETVKRFDELCELVNQASGGQAEARAFAKLPSYYVNEKFVRIIPFKDHINVEARAVTDHAESLSGYKITPKGMLQIFHNQPMPYEALRIIFEESLFPAE